MANLSTEKIKESGTVPTLVAASGGGDAIDKNTGKEFLYVSNGGGGSINVTFAAQNTDASNSNFGEIVKGDRIVAVAAGAVSLIGPFARTAFNDINGRVQVTYSGVTSVTVGVLSL